MLQRLAAICLVIASVPFWPLRAGGDVLPELSDGTPTVVEPVQQARQELAAAIATLEEYLHRGTEATSSGWKRFLRWDDLTTVASADSPSAQLIAEVSARFGAQERGLEEPKFTSVRTALANYAAATTNVALATNVQIQAPAGGGYSNVYGFASQRLAALGSDSYVNRVTPVRDCILGTDIHGTAHLTGYTSLVLFDNPNAASMAIVLNGQAASNTIGYNRGVTIRSTGNTQLRGEQPVTLTAAGFMGYAVRASACTKTNIYDICANCGLVERIAWRRADQQKAEAEAIASDHAADRLRNQMQSEAGPQLAQQNYRYYQEFVRPLQERGQFPEMLHFSSRRDRIQFQALQTDPRRGGAPDGPPGFTAFHDLGLQLHESAVESSGEGVLGGYELTDVRLEKLIRDELKQEVPEELQVTLPSGELDPEKEPWSIIFAKQLPLQARFQDGGLWLAIRAEGFTRGEGDEPGTYKPAITELIEIAAQYAIEQTPTGATLRRQGDVQIRFPNRDNPEQITVRDSPTVTFMRRKFRNMFKEEIVGEGLVLEGRLATAGRLYAREVQSNGGWLTVGWDMSGVQ